MLCAVYSVAAHAAGSNPQLLSITATGGVWRAGCGISAPQSIVELGTHPLEKFKTAGYNSNPVEFSLQIVGACYFGEQPGTGIIPDDIKRAKLYFEDASAQGTYFEGALYTDRGIGVQIGFNPTEPIYFSGGRTQAVTVPDQFFDKNTQIITMNAWLSAVDLLEPSAGQVSARMTVRLEYY